MSDALSTFQQLCECQAEASRKMIATAMQGAERVRALMGTAMKDGLDEQWELNHAWLTAYDPESLISLQVALFGHFPAALANDQFKLWKILSETGQQLGHCVAAAWGDFAARTAAAVPRRSEPAGASPTGEASG